MAQTDWDVLSREREKYDPASHNHTTTLGLSSGRRCCVHRRLTNILKRRLHQLASHGRALDVPISPHSLRQLIRLLRVDDAVGIILGSQIPLKAQNDDGQRIRPLKRSLDLIAPLPESRVMHQYTVMMGEDDIGGEAWT